MSCDNNVIKGKQVLFKIRNDADTAWEVVGGVKTLSYTVDNPVEDITSSSTAVDYLESEWTGYSQFNGQLSGYADNRTGINPQTGLNVVGSARILEIATSGNRCAKCCFLNVETNGTIEGILNFTNYSRNAESPGLVQFDLTLQSNSDVMFVGEV